MGLGRSYKKQDHACVGEEVVLDVVFRDVSSDGLRRKSHARYERHEPPVKG